MSSRRILTMKASLIGEFTLLAPLSHIGRSTGATSSLNRTLVVQPPGAIEPVEPVVMYTGNATRGMLRDHAADYMLDALDGPLLSLPVFHALYAGGNLSGETKIDVGLARRYRRAIPLLALWGAAMGGQILPGKMRVRQSYPVCREAIPVLPELWHEQARRFSQADLIETVSYSRFDDSKNPRHEARLLPRAGQQPLLTGAPGKRPREDAPEQMRISVEYLAAGAKLTCGVDLLDVSEVELGCFVSALHHWAAAPFIGGKVGSGHGLTRLDLAIRLAGETVPRPFIRVSGDGDALLSPPAEEAKDAYDAHLHALYDAFIVENSPEIVELLGSGR